MSDPWEHLLRVSDAVATARVEMARSGGGTSFSAKEIDCTRGRFGSAWTAELYDDDEHKEEGLSFACALLVHIAKGHCLTDGNKRLAWISFALVLTQLGLELEASEDEAADFLLKILSESLEYTDVCRWASERLVPLTCPQE